ncbi:transglutaminase-like cysteine peptidase [Qipengyuania zhejiangensis]|uniref:transglutaminase-like cysteine peptidase n=1 Tax=Qipengyuania zhejiangensis TaxID=3077782 RepID=UPI002D77E436|nr:transglutaminase-like cysteine peptidase [Qipengyuania sp. Z2]
MERSEILPGAVRGLCVAMTLAFAGTALPAQAQAVVPLVMPAITATIADTTCPIGNAAALGPVTGAPSDMGGLSKSAAILGGTGSALEAMRAAQSSLGNFGPLIPQSGPPAPSPIAIDQLRPATAAFALPVDCGTLFGTAPSRLAALAKPPVRPGLSADDFLASRKIPIGATNFDASWNRVSREKPRFGGSAKGLTIGNAGIETRLEQVNRWVNHKIAYAEDRDLFGKADHWAGPRRTMQLGKGDCEDYALLKMHLLAAAGIPREDMYLTIARDLVRRADHAVLVVRTPDGYRMLDNATDTVLDAGAANDYQPVLSFSGRRSFLHGY